MNQHKFSVINLKTDNLVNPLGIDSEKPFFSWAVYDNTVRGQMQTAYRITVAYSERDLECGRFVWDSGKFDSDETTLLKYAGERLMPSTRYC